jgi:hypothetical protein
MPVTRKKLDGGLGNRIAAEGVITLDDFLAARSEAFAEILAGAAPPRYVLFEAGPSAVWHMSTQDARDLAIADLASALIVRDLVVANLVATSQSYEQAVLWEQLVRASGWETRTFRDRGEARSWLKDRIAQRSGIEIAFAEA